MKRNELLKQLKNKGCVLLRSGSRHDIYINPKTGQKQPIPRHSEIDNSLANHIKNIWVLLNRTLAGERCEISNQFLKELFNLNEILNNQKR